MRTRSTRNGASSWTMLVIGVLMGAGGALLAGSLLAQQAARSGERLDALATLSQTATAVRASTGQALLIDATSADESSRAERLAIEDAEAAIAALEEQMTRPGVDAAVTNATSRLIEASRQALAEVEAGTGTADATALGLAHRTMIATTNGQRQVARESLSLAGADTGLIGVGLSAMVILLLPIAAIALLRRSAVSARDEAVVAEQPTVRALPERLVQEMEEGMGAVLSHARYIANARPRDIAAYRGLLSEAHRLQSVMRNLLSRERSRAGGVIVTAEAVELAPLVERLKAEASDMGRTIEVAGEEVVVRADPVRLHQVVDNLVAVITAHAPSRLGIVVGRTPDAGTICVVGDDVTITRDVLRALRQPAAEHPRTAALSLAVAVELVAAMAGTIEHRTIDEAAVFTLAFPLDRGRPT